MDRKMDRKNQLSDEHRKMKDKETKPKIGSESALTKNDSANAKKKIAESRSALKKNFLRSDQKKRNRATIRQTNGQ